MTKIKERQQAWKLRKEGKSYTQIKKHLKVSKGTLSRWLCDHPLTKEQIRLLRDVNEERIEKFRRTMETKRERRLQKTYHKEERKLLPLSKRELYFAGLFLYWGEGVKALKGPISLNNTDPKVVKFYLHWLTKAVAVPKERIRVYLHLYDDMDTRREVKFWSEKLEIPPTQFNKPYIKKSRRVGVDHKGFGHGTCGLAVNDVRLKERIMMGIKTVANYYGTKS